MKRVIQRKAKQYISDDSLLSESLKKQKRASQDIGNKTRTSAAMLGLALSMGATGSILSCHNKGAVAAEPKVSADVSSVDVDLEEVPNQLADDATSLDVDDKQVEAYSSFPHVIREGETLWTISNRYKVSSDALVKANGFDNQVVLRVGQKVVVPLSASTSTQLSPANASDSAVDIVVDASIDSSEEKLVQKDAVVDSSSPSGISSDQSKNIQHPKKISVDSAPLIYQSEHQASLEVSERLSVGKTDKDITPHGASEAVPSEPLLSAEDITSVVSVSDSDSVLVAQHVAFSDTGTSVSPQNFDTAAIDVTVPTTHQIQVGETLADIARRYSISTQELAQANRIRNPNRIFAGRVLNLPEGSVQTSIPSVLVDESPSENFLPDATVAALDLSTASDQQDSLVSSLPPISEIQNDEFVEPQVPAIVDSEPVDSSFYVDRLLGEIEKLSESYRSVPSSVESTQLSAVDSETQVTSETRELSASPDEVAYAPTASSSQGIPSLGTTSVLLDNEMVEPRAEDSLVQDEYSVSEDTTLQPSPELVAAAPLGAENYVPLNEPVTGRMVSPDLPPITGPDNYLPNGSTSFNGYVYPAQGTLTSGYGWRWGRMHRGIDVAAPIGTPIVSAAPGVVEYSGWNSGGYGNMVEVRHPDGSMTRYAHNSRNLVRVGQQVAQGEQIAEMGSTGYSTGPHVHFEIHVPNQGTVNPVAYLSQ